MTAAAAAAARRGGAERAFHRGRRCGGGDARRGDRDGHYGRLRRAFVFVRHTSGCRPAVLAATALPFLYFSCPSCDLHVPGGGGVGGGGGRRGGGSCCCYCCCCCRPSNYRRRAIGGSFRSDPGERLGAVSCLCRQWAVGRVDRQPDRCDEQDRYRWIGQTRQNTVCRAQNLPQHMQTLITPVLTAGVTDSASFWKRSRLEE